MDDASPACLESVSGNCPYHASALSSWALGQDRHPEPWPSDRCHPDAV